MLGILLCSGCLSLADSDDSLLPKTDPLERLIGLGQSFVGFRAIPLSILTVSISCVQRVLIFSTPAPPIDQIVVMRPYKVCADFVGGDRERARKKTELEVR